MKEIKINDPTAIPIPEGYEARIEDGKVIIEPKENEDERIRKHIIEILDRLAPCHWDGDEKSECIAYLEKQKAEWGEEDKGNLLDVQTIIDQVWHNQDAREGIERSEEELESLWHWLNNIWQKVAYPQPHWKPSDEQKKALFEAIAVVAREYPEDNVIADLLQRLYDDLKKL